MEQKNILIVSPFFFDYHNRIKRALEDRGACVDVVDEQPSHSVFARIMMRLDIPIYHSITRRYFRDVFSSLKKDYDYILFIKCEAPTVEVLQEFKKRFPFAKKILYLWDSVANIKSIHKKFGYFDKIFSFDKDDVKRYKFLEYAYWGYTKEFEVESNAIPKYDLAFIGTLHSVRPAVLSQIEKQCRHLGLTFYQFLYIPHPIVFLYNKLTNKNFKGVKYAQLHRKPLSTEETIRIYKDSKAVLEIENSRQSGATTRLGEMLGMQKKIVTTFNCKGEDYYRKENQLVIDCKNAVLNQEFFNIPYVPLPEAIRKKYSFDAFIDTLFKQ